MRDKKKMSRQQKATRRIMQGISYAISSVGTVNTGMILISICINYFSTETKEVAAELDRAFRDADMVGAGGLIDSMRGIAEDWQRSEEKNRRQLAKSEVPSE